MSDATIISLIGVAISAAVAFSAYVTMRVKNAQEITRVSGEAQNALQEAAEAKKRADDAHTSLMLHQQAYGMFQVSVAKEYADKALIHDVEMRVVGAVEKAAKSSNEAITALSKRIDDLADRRN